MTIVNSVRGRPVGGLRGSTTAGMSYGRSKTTRRTSITRIMKLIWTVYLIMALTYTTTFVVIVPTVKKITRQMRMIKGRIIDMKKWRISDNFLRKKTEEEEEESRVIQIVPRLLPHHISMNGALDQLKIRKSLKGTSVNTDEVIAEDEASLWTTDASHVGLEVSSSAPSSRLTLDRLALSNIITPSRLLNLDHPSNSQFIHWYPADHPLSGGTLFNNYNSNQTSILESLPKTIRKKNYKTKENFYLSKIFSESLGPSKIIPFFYKANFEINKDDTKIKEKEGKINKEDITIITLVTSNRFKVFEKLVNHYQGPISVTIHATDSPEILKPLLENLHQIYTGSEFMSTWVDVHLVVDRFDRQFNMWRNVAKYFARTEYVMMLDVDFRLRGGMRERMLGSGEIMGGLRGGKAAYVIPAFEYTKQSDGVNPEEFPQTKQDLIQLVNAGKIGMFHKSWKPGHAPSNYSRFFLPNNRPYPASGYSHSYEPYIIYKKDHTPFCDERFIGYGANKAACIFELYLSGVSFYVLPTEFLIHQSHAYAEKTRHHERKFNRKLYSDFREEVCFRYLNDFLKIGNFSFLSDAKNMIRECQKINGFVDAAHRLAKANQVAINFKVED